MKMELVKINERTKTDEENGVTYIGTEYSIGDYQVERIEKHYKDGEMVENIHVSASWEDRNEKFLPEIYFNDDWFGTKKKHFDIQTSSYGALAPEEIEKVIAGYQQAVEVVETLTDKFIGE